MRAIAILKASKIARKPWRGWTHAKDYPIRRLFLTGLKLYQKAFRKTNKMSNGARKGRHKFFRKQTLKKLRGEKSNRTALARKELRRAKRLTKSAPQHLRTVNFLRKHNKVLKEYCLEEGVEPVSPDKLPKSYQRSTMRILAAYKK